MSLSPSHTLRRPRRAFIGALALTLIAGSISIHTPPTAQALEASPNSPGTLTFTAKSPTGTPWIVPTGVTTLDVTVHSASGGQTGFTPGGAGTRSRFTLPVTPGDALMLYGSTEGDTPKYRDSGKGYHNGGRGGDRSNSAAIGAGGGGSSALLRNGQLVAEVGGGGGAGGESNNRCKNCGQYGTKILGGTGGVAGTDGAPGKGDIAGKPGLAGQHPDGNGSNGKSAATMSQGGGGGGGGGGYVGGSGGGAGRSFLGTGSGGGGGGGSSWYAPGITPVESTMRTQHDYGYVTLDYRTATRTTVSATPYVTEATPLDILVRTTNVHTSTLTPSGTLTVSGPGLTAPVTQTVKANETRVTLPGLAAGTHTLTARFTPTDGSTASQDDFTIDVRPATDSGIGAAPHASHTTVTIAGTATHGHTTPVTAQVTPELLGATATGTVTFELNGVDAGITATLDPSGTATAHLPATLNAGIYQLEAHYSGDSTLNASASAPVELIVQRTPTVATVTPSATNVTFGTPITVTLTAVTADAALQPDGIIGLMTNEGLLRLAELSGGSATIEHIILPFGTTALYASYAGDENGNFAESVSDPAVAVTVAEASTTTALTVDSAETLAGHGHQFTVTVSTGVANGTDPHGSIEIVLDGEVIDTAHVGGDIDARENDGIAQYSLTTDQVPNGTHRVTARFVPGTGFTGSESDAITVTVVPWHTETTATVLSPAGPADGTEAAQPRLAVDVRTLTPETPVSEGETPLAWGTVRAFVGDATSPEQAVSDAVEVGDGPQTLDLRGLTPGTHQVTLHFVPEHSATLPSEATVTVTVPAGGGTPGTNEDAAQGSDTGAATGTQTGSVVLANTGSNTAPGVWIPVAALALIGAAGIVFGRRRRASISRLSD